MGCFILFSLLYENVFSVFIVLWYNKIIKAGNPVISVASGFRVTNVLTVEHFFTLKNGGVQFYTEHILLNIPNQGY